MRCIFYLASVVLFLGLVQPAQALVTIDVSDSEELQMAFFAAATDNDDDLIVMAPGVYDLAASGGATTFIPQAADNGDFTLVGAGAGATIIDSAFANGPLVRIDYNAGPVIGDGAAVVTVQGITFRHGRTEGPGAGLFVSVTDALVRIVDCAFESNWARLNGAADNMPESEGSGAGAFLVSDGNADFHIEGSVFEDNAAELEGGGLMVMAFNGDVTAVGNRFLTNHAGVSGGGGFEILSSSGGLVFADNVAAENLVDDVSPGPGPKAGGVFALLFGGDTADIVNNTFYDNVSVGVGGVLAEAGPGGALNLYNNLFSQNTGATAADVFLPGAASKAVFHNLGNEICLGASSCETAVEDGFQGNVIGADPLLADPDAGDFHLLAGSPAVDAGDASAPSLPAEDFEGESRVIGAAPDIGADEKADPPAPATAGGTTGTTAGATTGGESTGGTAGATTGDETTGGEGSSGETTGGTTGDGADGASDGGCSLIRN
ncbi:MAG TPA: choice-of-anchor Q domain-containing protein [bacterium]|nr:choice-of-anchor Q domain-containing protein [bacterium]